MSTSDQLAPRDSYHHGDLRAELMDAAEDLLDEGGVGAVTLCEAARRCGVTPGATYRHFADKEALLAALAVRGFDAFRVALAAASSEGQHEPLAAMARAYVRFALARPGRFRLMFGPAVSDRSRYPDLAAAVEGASIGFRSAVNEKHLSDHTVAMLRAWSMIHGLTQLILDGMLVGHDPEQLVAAVTSGAGKSNAQIQTPP